MDHILCIIHSFLSSDSTWHPEYVSISFFVVAGCIHPHLMLLLSYTGPIRFERRFKLRFFVTWTIQVEIISHLNQRFRRVFERLKKFVDISKSCVAILYCPVSHMLTPHMLRPFWPSKCKIYSAASQMLTKHLICWHVFGVLKKQHVTPDSMLLTPITGNNFV